MIFEKVKNLISEQLGVNVEEIKMETDLINELEADSLDIVQMLITMESEFGIEFDDDEIKGLRTVGDVVKFIESLVK